MSLKFECHTKWNVTQNVISLKIKCEMSLKMEYHLKWNVNKNGMSFEIACYS